MKINDYESVDTSKLAEVIMQASNPVTDCRRAFVEAYKSNKGHMFDCILVVAVYLPTGATEIITNHYEVESRMKYYMDAYDDEFRLKSNPKVKVTGFMLV